MKNRQYFNGLVPQAAYTSHAAAAMSVHVNSIRVLT
jgi:hypothetical protein